MKLDSDCPDNCIIKVTSTKEFRTVVSICNRRGINWYNKDTDITDYFSLPSTYIYIDGAYITYGNDMPRASRRKNSQMYTFTEFTLKYSLNGADYEYRIKTEAEFKEENGLDWRKNVLFGFPPKMDLLFGMPLSKVQVDDFLISGHCTHQSFSISADMIKIANVKPITSVRGKLREFYRKSLIK